MNRFFLSSVAAFVLISSFAGAAEAPDFVRLDNEYTEEIRSLGPFVPEREAKAEAEEVKAAT